MHTSDRPSAARVPRHRTGSTAGRVLLITVVALAVLAAGLLVLADQARWLRLGVVAALWAALIGAFAAARYRRELLGHTDRADELQRVYELELEREVSARREYELEVETSTRRQVEQEVRGELDGLRTELQTLRQNLEALLGGEMLVQRVAPRAESTRTSQPEERTPEAGRAPAPQAQAGNPTDVLPRYRPGPAGSEPTAFRDHRPPPAAAPEHRDHQHRAHQHRTGRWRISREDPQQPPARQYRAPEPPADPPGVDLMADQPATAEPSPGAPARERFDSWVSANQPQAQPQPESHDTGGRRRRPDNIGPPPVPDLAARRRHALDDKPASIGTGRRRAPEAQGRTVDDQMSSYGDTPEPHRRHRREA